MSVLIKGINIHRGSCWECPCLDGEYGDCKEKEKDVKILKVPFFIELKKK